MALLPPRLTHRFHLAKSKDAPSMRALFDRLLDRGGEQFDAMQPFGVITPLGFQPAYDVWLSRHKGEVVAAGWYHLLNDGRVRVVALSASEHDTLTDTLLAHLEAGLQVIAYDGRFKITELTAWLPEGEPQTRLEQTYLRRGWTFVERPWTAGLHRATLRRDALLTVITQARAAGIDLHSMTDEVTNVMGTLTAQLGPLHPMYSAESLWQASEQGRVVAVSGIQYIPRFGQVVSMEPAWLRESAQPNVITRALLAAVLLEGKVLPDRLVGTGSRAALNDWFEGTIEVQVRDGYTLTIDPAREPLPWELGLGFNPDRVWLGLPG
ncbi:hypothetical protein HNQ07_004064 [Deinococcus metalli]|uniref:Uncharacterized protein n=1 Tax=Deinococcus metalli TaxID=1141878 RepID=A0A7W8KI58_9DEIO|nr:hypothetical protein [Deinococcus metalli]MBB5378557.1 hypothetical protein [Deinococcus metalli]GHF58594.1 hypothetical protein GCM10017781_38600 [Deinococcus metalli]